MTTAPTVYVMKGVINQAPYQEVTWKVYGTPDLTGVQSGYTGLINIVVDYTIINDVLYGPAAVPVNFSPSVVTAAGGDLSGTYPNPTVIKLQGNNVAPTTPTNNYVLTWSSSNNRWEPTSISSVIIGTPAGGDLSGTYPNPTVKSLTGSGGHITVDPSVNLFTVNSSTPFVIENVYNQQFGNPYGGEIHLVVSGPNSRILLQNNSTGLELGSGSLSLGSSGSQFTINGNNITFGSGTIGQGFQFTGGTFDGLSPTKYTVDNYYGTLPCITHPTSSTSPSTISTIPLASNTSFIIKGFWLARINSDITKTSSGIFSVSGYNNAGTITISSVITIGTDYNTGAGGAAATTPITVVDSGSNTILIQVNAQTSNATSWVMNIEQITE